MYANSLLLERYFILRFFLIIDDATAIEMHGIKKDKIIKAGDTIVAECTLTGGNPLGKITWLKGRFMSNDFS